MTQKGTILTRRAITAKSELLRGKALFKLLKTKFHAENGDIRFSYRKLAAQINHPEITANYLNTLDSRDFAPTKSKAQIIADYLQIPLDSIELSKHPGHLVDLQKTKKRDATEKTVTVNQFHLLANQFVSGKQSINTSNIGVGYVK